LIRPGLLVAAVGIFLIGRLAIPRQIEAGIGRVLLLGCAVLRSLVLLADRGRRRALSAVFGLAAAG
jgi:hypothetical protein